MNKKNIDLSGMIHKTAFINTAMTLGFGALDFKDAHKRYRTITSMTFQGKAPRPNSSTLYNANMNNTGHATNRNFF